MSRKSKTRRPGSGPSQPQTSQALPAGPNWPLLALSSIGVLLTAYLTWTTLSGSPVQGCAVGGGCDTVLSSPWATLFGLPTSLWGLLGYAALAGVAGNLYAAKLMVVSPASFTFWESCLISITNNEYGVTIGNRG